MLGYGSVELICDTLLTALQAGPYACGDRFNAADVYFRSEVMLDLHFTSLPVHSLLGVYRDRLLNGPLITAPLSWMMRPHGLDRQ